MSKNVLSRINRIVSYRGGRLARHSPRVKLSHNTWHTLSLMTTIDKTPADLRTPHQLVSKVTLQNGNTILPGFSPPVLAEIEGIESKKEEDKILPRGTQSSRLEEPVWTTENKERQGCSNEFMKFYVLIHFALRLEECWLTEIARYDKL